MFSIMEECLVCKVCGTWYFDSDSDDLKCEHLNEKFTECPSLNCGIWFLRGQDPQSFRCNCSVSRVRPPVDITIDGFLFLRTPSDRYMCGNVHDPDHYILEHYFHLLPVVTMDSTPWSF